MNNINWTVQLSNNEWKLIWLGYWLLDNGEKGFELHFNDDINLCLDSFHILYDIFNVTDVNEKECLYILLKTLNWNNLHKCLSIIDSNVDINTVMYDVMEKYNFSIVPIKNI